MRRVQNAIIIQSSPEKVDKPERRKRSRPSPSKKKRKREDPVRKPTKKSKIQVETKALIINDMDSSATESDDEVDGDDLYEVEVIVGYRVNSEGVEQYCVKWKGYEELQWEVCDNVFCDDLVREYHTRQETRQKAQEDLRLYKQQQQQ